jgi:hypothetical protein
MDKNNWVLKIYVGNVLSDKPTGAPPFRLLYCILAREGWTAIEIYAE